MFVSATLLSVCAYANTCTFDGVQVSLQEGTVQIQSQYNNYWGWINITVDNPSKKEVRCQVEVGGKRRWITVPLKNGSGSYNIGKEIGLPEGSYPVKLIQQGGMCY